jgi:hypothetical protein
MKCIETRRPAHGMTRRRYEKDDGTTLTTYEVPEHVLRPLMRRVVRERPDDQAETIAESLGIPVSYILRIKREVAKEIC